MGAIALCAVATHPESTASGDTATLTGAVIDVRGQPIAGARVTLSGYGAATTQSVTEIEGTFRFPALRPGAVYSIAVEHPGYRSVEYEGLRLEPSRARVIDFRLKRPGERDVVILASRDPFPFQELVRGFLRRLDAPARVYDLDREPDPGEMVRRVQAERPNLILGAGLRAARLIRRDVREVPVILTLISEPRHHDLEAPNICFVSNNPRPADLLGRLAAILPGVRRLGVLYDAQASSLLARDLRSEARRRGLRLETRPCYSVRTLEKALAALAGRIDALAVPYDPLSTDPEVLERVTGWALRHRLPLASPAPEWVRRGALFSYGATPEGLGQDAAWIAWQILFHDRQPSDFSLRDPRYCLLAINEGTALALGIDLPADLKADLTY